MGPRPALTEYFSLFGSLVVMSNTEERRPPYLAGIPPLKSSMPSKTSELNIEKNPKKCDVLYTVAPSIIKRF